MKGLPTRWVHRHGAYYYRPREIEKQAFDGKTWFRLGVTYHEALRAFADRMEIQVSDKLHSLIDRYTIEILPTLSHSAQNNYRQSLERLRAVMGTNPVGIIKPSIIYQYMDTVQRKKKSKGIANQDLMVLNRVLDYAVRWGVIDLHPIKGQVKAYGIRDGLQKARTRYIEDWELAEWQKVASRQQRAFAALILLTGIRKSDCLRLMDAHVGDTLVVNVQKNGRPLEFELSDALKAAIAEARACKPKASLYLLPNRLGRCYVNDKGECASWGGQWYLTMRKAIDQTELEETFTMHDLRAKVGSDAENDQRAQELLDHSSVSMTRKHYRRKRRAIRPVK